MMCLSPYLFTLRNLLEFIPFTAPSFRQGVNWRTSDALCK